MKFDIKHAHEAVKETLQGSARAAYTGIAPIDWTVYETALLAQAGMPDRPRTVAYTLGIRAGVEFHLIEKPSVMPFHKASDAWKDFVLGFSDALLVRQAADQWGADQRTGTLFAMIFGGA